MITEKRRKSKVKVFTNKQKTTKPEIEYIRELQAKYNDKVDISKIKLFKDFPLSYKTLKGLKDAGYKIPTEIQKEAILLGLRGNDVLGAAKTGSGKTLAFLIPMLEKLFCEQWTHLDGLGALIITPTRELALQIFETLKKIGANHDFSCGLIIGGKDLKFERKRVNQCNIMICTPGRLLQHMDENPLFDASNLQILILDEADRCLDMGFKATMNAIIANLPQKRQTFLFSATQTKSVKDLARLNLKDPSYVAVHENEQHSTPESLEQSYYICELKDKVAVLWSFIKMHLKKKVIVFLSTCKQVKFIFEIFSKMRPGVPLMALYSRMHQLKRIKVYEEFSRKSSAVLFATDIVARGLDFPEVHWVVQVDCPEDADTYIHRVGRTARFFKGGESLLLLMPSELRMLQDLEKKKVPISPVKINPLEIKDPFRKMETFMADDTALQYTAKRAFVTYLKSAYMMKKRRDIFNIEALDLDSFARSYGLTSTPRLTFLKKAKNEKCKNEKVLLKNPNKIYFDEDGNPVNGAATKDFQSKPTEIENEESNSDSKYNESDGEMGGEINEFGKELNENFKSSQHFMYSGDELENVPKPEEDLSQICEQEIPKKKKPTTKVAILKKMLKEKTVTNKIIKFDEIGEPIGKPNTTNLELCYYEDRLLRDKLVEKIKEIDEFDKQVHREKVKSKHKEQKRKLKEQKKTDKDDQVDDFGESESEEEVDLSWLPDPKKIYGDDGGNQEQSDLETKVETSKHDESITLKEKKRKRKLEENCETQRKKLKKSEQNNETLKNTKKKIDKIKEMTSELTVNEAEELALMLLQK